MAIKRLGTSMIDEETCRRKKRYRLRRHARAAIARIIDTGDQKNERLKIFVCDHCHGFHIGNDWRSER